MPEFTAESTASLAEYAFQNVRQNQTQEEDPSTTITREEYSTNFYNGFADGKKSQGITEYTAPIARSHSVYHCTTMEAYRQGFNLALMGEMMNLKMIDSSGKWFPWYCARKRGEI